MPSATQSRLFEPPARAVPRDSVSTTFADNMKLPVHRWMRYSAGYSAEWARSIVSGYAQGQAISVLDPFAGSGTTLIAAQDENCESFGIESHPFVVRMARAKLQRTTSIDAFRSFAGCVRASALGVEGRTTGYPSLIAECYSDAALRQLDALRRALGDVYDGTPQAELTWLALASMLRKVSHANTAQWQYILPAKTKSRVVEPMVAFDDTIAMFAADMQACQLLPLGPTPTLLQSDARTCGGVPDGAVDLIVTSPPYPNNYDYADATRLEMSFFGEVTGWGDLQATVRKHLIRSCSQHVPERAINLDEVLSDPVLQPIKAELSAVCAELGEIRLTKGGKKTYHLMVACYFQDLARTWVALRRVCRSPSRACFVIGDSAPYGVYVPVVQWFERLSEAAGFHSPQFEQTRERNTKWKNRKHRVPLCEGRFWVDG